MLTGADVVCVEACGEKVSTPVIDAGRFRYVFDPKLKPGVGFSAGAFFTKAVLSDEVFRYPRSRRIGVLTESPIDPAYRNMPEIVRRFPLIFTHQRDLLELGGPFRPMMFGSNWIGARDPASTNAVLEEHPEKNALVSFMGSLEHSDSGAYRFRREIAELVIQRGDVHCYGRGIRPVDGKREALQGYRFSIAMENAASDDYFSEKLVDCLLLETIPIYYGWPSIADHLDPRGYFVFQDTRQLADILDRLTPELYEQMRPFALENKSLVVANRWHSHQAMLERVSEQLPAALYEGRAIPYRPRSRIERGVRRVLRRLV